MKIEFVTSVAVITPDPKQSLRLHDSIEFEVAEPQWTTPMRSLPAPATSSCTRCARSRGDRPSSACFHPRERSWESPSPRRCIEADQRQTGQLLPRLWRRPHRSRRSRP